MVFDWNKEFEQLKQDLATLDVEAIHQLSDLLRTKSILMKKRGVHDVLSHRIELLGKQREELQVQFLERAAAAHPTENE